MNDRKKGMIAATLAFVIFGLSYLFSKKALNIAEPAILLCARFTVAYVVLNAMVLTGAAKVRVRGRALLWPVFLGVMQPVLYFIFENYGLKYTTTSFTGLMSSISPALTAVLGAVVLRERPTKRQWAFIGVSIAGVLMISLRSGGGQNTAMGCLCLFAAYFTGALCSMFVRKVSDRYTPFELTYVMFSVGFVFFVGMAFVQFRGEALPMLAKALGHGDFVVAALYLGAAASVGGYLLANYALSKLPAARYTVFANVSTVVSVL